MWWPRAAPDRLKTCTFWFLWLFTWDDEIDQSTSDLFLNIQNANQFRKESLEYVKFCLGVGDEETAKWDFQNSPPQRKLIRSLDVIGEELRKVYNYGASSSSRRHSSPVVSPSDGFISFF